MKDKYKTLITACWIVLLCCFVVKLLGGNWFEIVCTNEKFIAFCNMIGIQTIQYYVISLITSIFANGFIIMAMLQQKVDKNKITITVFISILILSIIKYLFDKFLPIPIILTIFDLLMLFGVPMIINYKKWKRIIFGIILTLIFQIISLITKNLGVHNIDNNVLVTLIFMIDYFIMILLYYLYSIKEEQNGSICSIFSRFRKRRND